MSDSVRPRGLQPTRLLRPWDSPGKNTGLGCHFLLQCMKVKSESEVAQSRRTLSDVMDCGLPGTYVHGFSRQEYWSRAQLSVELISSGYFVNIYRVFSFTQGILFLCHFWVTYIIISSILRCKARPVLLIVSYQYHILMMSFYYMIF